MVASLSVKVLNLQGDQPYLIFSSMLSRVGPLKCSRERYMRASLKDQFSFVWGEWESQRESIEFPTGPTLLDFEYHPAEGWSPRMLLREVHQSYCQGSISILVVELLSQDESIDLPLLLLQ